MTNQTTTPRISANTNQRTRVLTYTALMAAISTVVMFFEFTFPPFPPFLKFDLSGLPILLTAFIMGPVQAIIVTLIKDLFHVLSTTTGGVGELADFLILSSFAVTAGLIHRKMPSVKGTALACFAGTVAIAIVSLAAYILFGAIPFNVAKGIVISIVTVVTYKKLGHVMKFL